MNFELIKAVHFGSDKRNHPTKAFSKCLALSKAHDSEELKLAISS